MFEDGSLRLTHGKITILPLDRDTPERQRGLLEVAPFRNGSRPDHLPVSWTGYSAFGRADPGYLPLPYIYS